MFNIFLTQSSGFLGTIAKPFGWILNGIYEFLNLFGIENVAISIIVFTFIAKALMIPLTIKQQKFSKMSSIMQPEISKVQAKYQGKKDEASVRKMQLEQQAIYEKYGVSPTAGCLPLLITFPIILAMYRVVQNVPAYVPSIKALYEQAANTILATDYQDVIKEIASNNNNITLSKFSEFAESGTLTVNHMIDVLSKLNTSQWTDLANGVPAISSTITTLSKSIIRINEVFFGLNVANAPGLSFPGIIIPALAVITQWLQTKLMTSNNPTDPENPTANAMKSMNTIMPLFSGFICVGMPIGLGIYWVASAVFGIIQQIFVNKYMNSVDVNDLIEKSKVKADKKRAKVSGLANGKLNELAKTQTKGIDAKDSSISNVNKEKTMKDIARLSSNKEVNTTNNTSNKKSEVSYKAGSIAANANLLKNRYNDKGEK